MSAAIMCDDCKKWVTELAVIPKLGFDCLCCPSCRVTLAAQIGYWKALVVKNEGGQMELPFNEGKYLIYK